MISVGLSIPAFKMDDNGFWWKWMENLPAIRETTQAQVGMDVEWAIALEYDARGRERFNPLFERLASIPVPVKVFWYSFDNGDNEIGGAAGEVGKVMRICTGRNIVLYHANHMGAEWHYATDADVITPDDGLVRLLELDYPATALNCPTFCLSGPKVRAYPDLDVRQHWHSGCSLLMRRDLFRRVPWRFDVDAGQWDDSATMSELERIGFPVYVRHDVQCEHFPMHVKPTEQRGHDLRVHR